MNPGATLSIIDVIFPIRINPKAGIYVYFA